MHGSVNPTMSPRGQTTGSIKTIKNINNLVFQAGSRDLIAG
ncbi:hypothetical protein [Rickettsia asembonensis]|nr:hypothetical protein [Rickettsia asembonensis]